MKIRIPDNSLVVLIGVSGSGKSAFAQKYFPKESIISSDQCRRLVCGDKGSVGPLYLKPKTVAELQGFSEGAFLVFYSMIRARLRHNLLTVADSTALKREYREELFKIAGDEHVKITYIVVDTPFSTCVERDSKRIDTVGESIIKRQSSNLNRSRGWIRNADDVYVVKPEDEVEIEYTHLDLSIKCPAIDVIGDIHGCIEELLELVSKLGYVEGADTLWRHSDGRKLVFVGDLIDRGPQPYQCLDFVRQHVEHGLAELVLSNHENKCRQFLSGRHVNMKPEFQASIDSFPADLDKSALKKFLYSLKPYRIWSGQDGKKWVIAHAAFDPKFMNKLDGYITNYCVYGPVRSVDPVTHRPDRIAWWETYRYGPNVVYGHLACEDGKPRIINDTFGIDTGCVHGLNLTALRLPEQEIVQVKAKAVYFGTPILVVGVSLNTPYLMPLLSKPVIKVKGVDGSDQEIVIRGGLMDAVAQISTKVKNPDKLMWLAPTMSPGPVSNNPELVEDPVTTAKWMFDNAPAGTEIIAELKHMGSRGTWRCQKVDGQWDIFCYTKNGFEMFDEPFRSKVYDAMQKPLDRLGSVFKSDLLLLDSEVMPWNQHGDAWLEKTFMATAAAGHISRFAMARAAAVSGHKELAKEYERKMHNIVDYGNVSNQYCWKVKDFASLKIGIFDILYPVLSDTEHDARIELLEKHLREYSIFQPTDYRIVTSSDISLAALSEWWSRLTKEGAEGVVLKYNNPKVWSNTKYPQQQLKVRGSEYLKIVYGPNYRDVKILKDLRNNHKVEFKMRHATQETLLGQEAIRRYSNKEPFERYHECVLGILSGSKASLDPRL